MKTLTDQVANSLNVNNGTDSLEQESVPKHDLFIYKDDCLKCSHLCKNLKNVKTETFKCTFENGNDRCPAHIMTISRDVDVEKIAKDIYRAKARKDIRKYSRRVARLEEYPSSIIDRIMKRVDELTQAESN